MCNHFFETDVRMLIQKLQKWWIENPSLLTCVKTIQNSVYGVVLYCFYMHEISLDFSMQHVFAAENFTTLFITLPYWNVNPKTQKILD